MAIYNLTSVPLTEEQKAELKRLGFNEPLEEIESFNELAPHSFASKARHKWDCDTTDTTFIVSKEEWRGLAHLVREIEAYLQWRKVNNPTRKQILPLYLVWNEEVKCYDTV